MPLNWEKFEKDVNTAVKTSGKVTDQKLASKMSSVTRLTDDEIQKLFPTPTDAKRLFELMKIVKSASHRNTKIKEIVLNAERFAGIIVTLLSKTA
ncbi:MAG: hypothetical protein R6U50_02345 [Desulfobacterales bacterium]